MSLGVMQLFDYVPNDSTNPTINPSASEKN
jgi:hypothetical protein